MTFCFGFHKPVPAPIRGGNEWTPYQRCSKCNKLRMWDHMFGCWGKWHKEKWFAKLEADLARMKSEEEKAIEESMRTHNG